MIAFGANDQTIYLNGAVVPSVKARGRKKGGHDPGRPVPVRAIVWIGRLRSEPDRTEIMKVLISETGPAAAKPGPDRADRPTTIGEVCDVRGCCSKVGDM